MFLRILLVLAAMGQQQSSVMNQWENPDEVTLWGQGTADGKKYSFIVSAAALAKTPEWIAEKQEPPFSILQAIAAAKKAALADHPKFDDVVADSVEVRRAPGARSDNYWFYRVELSPVIEGRRLFGSDLTVVLLMDGTIVKPQERKGHW